MARFKKGKSTALGMFLQITNVFAIAAIGIILVPLLIDKLSLVGFGVFESISILLGLAMLSDIGIGNVILKYGAKYKDSSKKFNDLFWTYAGIKIAISLSLALFVLLVSSYIDVVFPNFPKEIVPAAKASIKSLAAGLLLTTGATLLSHSLKSVLRFDLAEFALLVSHAAVLCAVTTIEGDFFSICLVYFVLKPLVHLITSAVLLIGCARVKLGIPRFSFKTILETKSLLAGSSAVVLLSQGLTRIPKLALVYLVEPTGLGLFAIVEKLKAPLGSILDALIRPLIPLCSEAEQKNDTDRFYTIIKVFFVLHSTFNGLVLATIPQIEPFLVLWINNTSESLVLGVQVMLLIFACPNPSTLIMVQYSEGKTRSNIEYTLAHMLAGITMGIGLTWYLGWTGMVIGPALTAIYLSIHQLNSLKTQYKITNAFLFRQYAASYTAATIAAFTVSNVHIDFGNEWLEFMLKNSFLILVYFSISIPGTYIINRPLVSNITKI